MQKSEGSNYKTSEYQDISIKGRDLIFGVRVRTLVSSSLLFQCY